MQIIWLWKGVAGDDSVVNGHVDNFCCFLAPGVVALAWPNDENDFNDPQYEISMDAYERLSNTTGEWGLWGDGLCHVTCITCVMSLISRIHFDTHVTCVFPHALAAGLLAHLGMSPAAPQMPRAAS